MMISATNKMPMIPPISPASRSVSVWGILFARFPIRHFVTMSIISSNQSFDRNALISCSFDSLLSR